jgi:uncharacterized membrane protein YdjX (TVP38/TMEM64 family)
MGRLRLMFRLGAIAALAAVVLVCIGQYVWPQAIARIDGVFDHALRGLYGLDWVGFVLVQVLVAISGFLPASLVGVSAGAAYGVRLGFATASISTLIGAVIAFLLSRSLLRPFIKRKLSGTPHLSSLDGQIRNQGWRFVCVLRLSPVAPFAATSYALGLSSIALGEYLAGTLASLPSLLVYVLAGAAVKTGVSVWAGGEKSIRIALLAFGAFSTAILIVQVARALRRVAPAEETTASSSTGNGNLGRLAICTRALWYQCHGSSAPSKEVMCEMNTDAPELAARRNRRG